MRDRNWNCVGMLAVDRPRGRGARRQAGLLPLELLRRASSQHHVPAWTAQLQLHRTRGDGASLEVLLLAVDMLQLPGLVAALLLEHEHLYLCGEVQEAGIEVAGDPLPAAVGDTVRGLGGVVALLLSEEHDLGAVVLSAQQPGLVLLVERSPEVAVPVGPALGLEPPAAVGVPLEANERALTQMPRSVLQPVRVARAGGDLRADAEVTGGGLLAAARGQLIDVLAQLLGVHAGAGVCDRQLAYPAARGVEPLPVEVPHHAADSALAERGDRVEPVHGQLAQALKVGALAAEALEQEGGVRDGELVPAIDCRGVAVGCVVALRKLAGHLVW